MVVASIVLVLCNDGRPMPVVDRPGGVTIEWASATDVGLVRSVNEDSVVARSPVFVVADGMGGHHAGEVASAAVVEAFERAGSVAALDPAAVVELIGTVNSELSSARSNMGTTAVGLLLVESAVDPQWLVFNVGDSRAYRLHRGVFEQLTTDHSYVQELIDSGEIEVAAARSHPQRNVVTRGIGIERRVRPDMWLLEPTVGERFLLCSDGLSSEVTDESIREVLLTVAGAQAAANELVQRALAAGGRDNITVVVVDVMAIDPIGSAVETTAPRPGEVPVGLAPMEEAGVEIAGVPQRLLESNDGVRASDEVVTEMMIDEVPPPGWGLGED